MCSDQSGPDKAEASNGCTLTEYQEAAEAFRQIDTRIWNIYGLYLAGCGAATVYVLTQPEKLTHYAIVGFSLAVIAASLGQMALVGHLQWGSDILAFRMRAIESILKMDSHRRFIQDIQPRLWGGHRWWFELRARDIMQVAAWAIVLVWIGIPYVYKGSDKNPIDKCELSMWMFGGTIVLIVALFIGSFIGRKRRLASKH